MNTVWDCVSCNVGGWTPAFENFVQVVVVVLGLRVFASEACFTLGQPQLNGEARRSPVGYGEVVGIFTLFDDGSVVQVVSLVRASLEYLAIDTFSYVSAPGRLAAEGDPRPLPSSRRTLAAVTFVVPARLYSYGHRSCRPQPLGSRREGTPCEDTRQDR